MKYGKDYPIQPIPFTEVTLGDNFWLPRLETNRNVTLPYDFSKCEDTGRVDNFLKAAGQHGRMHIPASSLMILMFTRS